MDSDEQRDYAEENYNRWLLRTGGEEADTRCWMSDVPGATPCAGPVDTYRSRSGATEAERCERHQEEHDRYMDELEARLQRDYPGYDVPGSPPPAWLDPANAGERWDDE